MGLEESDVPGRVSKGESGTKVRTEQGLSLTGYWKEGSKWSHQEL